MYKIYPVSLPLGRRGGSQDTIIVLIELITALISAGTDGAKKSKTKLDNVYKFLLKKMQLLSSSVLQ